MANNFVLTANSTVSGSNSLTVTGSFTFGADGNDITNSMTAGSTLELAGNVFLSNSETSSFTAEFFGGGTTLISGVIANNSGNNTLASHLFFNALGILRLTGVNTYTGRTLAAGGGALAISQDRNLGLAPTSPFVDSIILASTGRLRIEESFTLDVNRTIGIGNSTGGAATGTIEVITDKTFTVNGVITNRTVNPNGTATTGLPNVGSLTKTGNGVLVLGGNNTYSGTTTVSAGVLRISSNTALGDPTAGTTVNSGAQLELMNGVTITGETITLNGSGRVAASPGSPDINRGSLQAAAGATATWAGNVILASATNSRLGAQAGGTLIVTGVIDDGLANNVLQIGADMNGGKVILSGANTYGDGITATTEIARGTLQLGAHNTLPTVTILDIHFSTNNTELATVDMFGFNQAVSLLRNTGNSNTFAVLTNSDVYTLSTLTINQNANSTYGGIITGNVSIVKNGAGTLTLTRNNTYTGDTVINEGTIILAGGVALPDGAGKGNVIMNGGVTTAGSLDLNNVNEAINALNGTSGAVLGRVYNNATNTTVRVLTVGSDGNSGSYAGQILDNTGGAALGRVAITKIGRGTQVFSGANTSTGTVTAYNGKLVFDYTGGADVLNAQLLALRNGHVTFKGNSSGTTSDTIGTIVTGSTTNNRIVVDNNGGAGTTITSDNTVGWTSGTTTSSIYFDLSSGGVFKTLNPFLTTDANAVSLKNGILMAGTAAMANTFRGVFFVQDATGLGFATQNASNELVRYTAATTAIATSNSTTTNFIMAADLNHAGTAFSFSTLQMDTGSTFISGESIDLSMGSSSLLTTSAFNGHALLITGANNASISGTGSVQNSLFIANHSTGTFTLDMSMNGQAIVNIGTGLTIYNRSNVPGDVYAAGGVLRFTQDMSYTLNIVRIYGGGVLELGADLNGADTGAFNRALGIAAGNVALFGNGGFSAFGATRVVTLGGVTPADLTWGASNFLTGSDGVDGNHVFMLGSSTSNATLEFTNNINLGTRTRTIDVGNGVNANDVDARLTGVLSGANGALEKIGTGTLETTAANTYGMGTTIAAGTFLANNTTGSATGTGKVTVSSGATLGGTGTVTASTGTQHITVNSGATLMVGNTHGVAAGGGGAASDISLQTSAGGVITLGGTVQIDLFGNTNNGSGTNPATDNDVLRLTSETSVVLDGILAIIDTTGTSLSWGLGSTWLLIDWATVSAAAHNSGTFDDVLLPTLNSGLAWDTSKLYTDGTISVAAVVPEPGRAVLFITGIATLLMGRRRSRK
ncbi:MAG: beta strand repeat-containing protein [Roseimicrobium sp.]